MKKLKEQLKQAKMKAAAAILLFVLTVVAGGVVLVRAYSSDQPVSTVIEHADNVTVQAPLADTPGNGEVSFGASPLDSFASNRMNVNGYEVYYLRGFLGSFNGNSSTTVAFANPFLAPTSTAGDVVLEQVNDAYGYTGATSTVTLVEITARNATTTVEYDCGASANRFTTSTPLLLNTEQRMPTSTAYVVRSDMASSTNPGSGSFVQDAGYTPAAFPVTRIVLTPQKPWLVCKVWQPYGTSLTTFTDAAGTADVKLTARIERQR